MGFLLLVNYILKKNDIYYTIIFKGYYFLVLAGSCTGFMLYGDFGFIYSVTLLVFFGGIIPQILHHKGIMKAGHIMHGWIN